MSPFLTLHASQIQELVDAVGEPAPAVRVKASPETKMFAAQALRAAGIHVPPAGAFTQVELDAALDGAFDPANPMSPRKRMEAKSQAYAAGLVLERPHVNTRAIVTAGLMLKKAKIPAPTGKPYTVREFDQLLAATDLASGHRLETINADRTPGGYVEPARLRSDLAKPAYGGK